MSDAHAGSLLAQLKQADEDGDLPEELQERYEDELENTETESLPTIEYVSEAGSRWRERYERVEDKPWKVERHVDHWDPAAEEWEPAGGEVLRQLSIDGMPRSATEIALFSHEGDSR